MNLSQSHIDEHNRLYNEASKLMRGEIHLDDKELPPPGWFVRRRLKKAIVLFKKTLSINSAGWNAMLWIAKIEQRFGHDKESLDWMLKAREFAPDNPTLAKEAAMMATKIGDHETGARIADEAIQIKPEDAALQVNSGVAHLYAGRYDIAITRFRKAAALEPDRGMNRKLEAYAIKVGNGSLQAPRNETDILRDIK